MAYYQNEFDQYVMHADDFSNKEQKLKEKQLLEEVREYVLSVVSGTMLPIDSEHGYMYVSYEKLIELVEEGYNIVSVLNMEDLSPYRIHIEYQKYKKINTNKHGR